uniref:Uncharacterized protein n=1 Tax=Micrurus spixii TaxID=129469 RepID=A0A2D4NC61_9SAUR
MIEDCIYCLNLKHSDLPKIEICSVNVSGLISPTSLCLNMHFHIQGEDVLDKEELSSRRDILLCYHLYWAIAIHIYCEYPLTQTNVFVRSTYIVNKAQPENKYMKESILSIFLTIHPEALNLSSCHKLQNILQEPVLKDHNLSKNFPDHT